MDYFPLTLCLNLKLKEGCFVPLSKAGLDPVQGCFEICALESVCLSALAAAVVPPHAVPHSGRRRSREVSSGKELTCGETNPL